MLQILTASRELKGRRKADGYAFMASLDEGRVAACRPGSIADESDSDAEDDEAGDDSRFWLFVVVQKCCVSPDNQPFLGMEFAPLALSFEILIPILTENVL